MPQIPGSKPHPFGTSIRLFLVDGTPDGLWVVEKSNWTGLALMAARSRYADLRMRPEMGGSGVYVLIGPPEGGAKSSRIYIGETDALKNRLDLHQKEKDFWTKVVIFTAKDANLNKAVVRYLESRLQAIAFEANRAELDNIAATSLPTLSEADQAQAESFLADMLLIYPVLGLNAFEKAAEVSHGGGDARLYLTAKDTRAEGSEASDGFVVLAGAVARNVPMASLPAHARELRESLISGKLFAVDGEQLRLTQDYVFSSPSTAATVLLGRSANGRIEWRNLGGGSP